MSADEEARTPGLLEAGAIGEQHDGELLVRDMENQATKQSRQECQVLSSLQGDSSPHGCDPGLLLVVRHQGRLVEMQEASLMPGFDRALPTVGEWRAAGSKGHTTGLEGGHDLVPQSCTIDPDGTNVVR